MDTRQRNQVEESLGRNLTKDELVVVDDVSSLPESHLSVIEALYQRDPIGALYYIVAVTKDGDRSVARSYVQRFDAVAGRRNKRSGLRERELYEGELGRKLTSSEVVEVDTLEVLNDEQRALIALLARKDRGLALAFLRDVVPFASSHERQMFLDILPKQ